MSTRSNITIKIRNSDVKNGVECNNVIFKDSEYLSVYCHFDGYIEYTGKELVKRNYTYEDALSFILKGDRSSVEDGMSYTEWRNESYNTTKPKCMTSPAVSNMVDFNYLMLENEDTKHMDVYVYIDNIWKKLYINDNGICQIDETSKLKINE